MVPSEDCEGRSALLTVFLPMRSRFASTTLYLRGHTFRNLFGLALRRLSLFLPGRGSHQREQDEDAMKLLTFVPLPVSGGFEVAVYEWDRFAQLALHPPDEGKVWGRLDDAQARANELARLPIPHYTVSRDLCCAYCHYCLFSDYGMPTFVCLICRQLASPVVSPAKPG
jgi:hypothetical protein